MKLQSFHLAVPYCPIGQQYIVIFTHVARRHLLASAHLHIVRHPVGILVRVALLARSCRRRGLAVAPVYGICRRGRAHLKRHAFPRLRLAPHKHLYVAVGFRLVVLDGPVKHHCRAHVGLLHHCIARLLSAVVRHGIFILATARCKPRRAVSHSHLPLAVKVHGHVCQRAAILVVHSHGKRHHLVQHHRVASVLGAHAVYHSVPHVTVDRNFHVQRTAASHLHTSGTVGSIRLAVYGHRGTLYNRQCILSFHCDGAPRRALQPVVAYLQPGQRLPCRSQPLLKRLVNVQPAAYGGPLRGASGLVGAAKRHHCHKQAEVGVLGVDAHKAQAAQLAAVGHGALGQRVAVHARRALHGQCRKAAHAVQSQPLARQVRLVLQRQVGYSGGQLHHPHGTAFGQVHRRGAGARGVYLLDGLAARHVNVGREVRAVPYVKLAQHMVLSHRQHREVRVPVALLAAAYDELRYVRGLRHVHRAHIQRREVAYRGYHAGVVYDGLRVVESHVGGLDGLRLALAHALRARHAAPSHRAVHGRERP